MKVKKESLWQTFKSMFHKKKKIKAKSEEDILKERRKKIEKELWK